ncbi:MAG: VWA domain-containing protein [Rhodospirillales bacterium]|nr:VWA domain-containing protein [Rhodospirillales bacterium]
MAEIRLTTTPAAGYRRLQVHGQSVVTMHQQLASLLANRLGQPHARLLSRPQIDSESGDITWFTSGSGPARRLDDLAPGERQRFAGLCQRLIAEIGELAGRMRNEGGSAVLVGHMLDLAVITPSDDAALTPSGNLVFIVDELPVLSLWGHAREAQAVPDLPSAAVASPAPVAPASPSPANSPPTNSPPASALPASSAELSPSDPPASPDHPVSDAQPGSSGARAAADKPAAAAASEAAAAPVSRRGWLPWLLPLALLLLVAWLGWRALLPLAPVIVDRPGENPPAAGEAPATDALAAEEARAAALRGEIARLEHERDARLALCKPIPPEPPKAEANPPAEKASPPVIESAPPKEPVPQPKPAPQLDTKPKPKPEAKPAPKVEVKPRPPAPPPSQPSPPASGAAVPKTDSVPPPQAPKSACNPSYGPGDEPEVVVIVDGSGSMGEPFAGASSRMALAQDSIAHVVNGLPSAVDVALIDFIGCDQVRLDKFYSAPQRGSLIGEVRGLRPGRGTPLARSIERAGNIVSSGVQSAIVVVSDGTDTCGQDPCAAARAVKAKRPNVTINVIDVSGGDGRATAQCIAGATGGKVLTPNSMLDMSAKVQQATRLPDTRACGH